MRGNSLPLPGAAAADRQAATACPVNKPLTFEIDAGHFARALDLNVDRAAVISLGRGCMEYITTAFDRPVSCADAPYMLPGLLRPAAVPAVHGLAFGIYSRSGPGDGLPATLTGLLALLRPPDRQHCIWYINLLLLETTARNRGLGTDIHRAFVPWARSQGACSLLVSVAHNNPQAWRFWHDRLGYREFRDAGWLAVRRDQTSRELSLSLTRNASAPGCKRSPVWRKPK